jgi:hypothetical protein
MMARLKIKEMAIPTQSNSIVRRNNKSETCLAQNRSR